MCIRDRTERVDRVPVAMPDESRAAAWLRAVRPSGTTLVALGLIVAALVVLAPSLKTFFEQRQQIAQLQAEVTGAHTQVDDLGMEIARWSDPAYIEAQARDRLYYVLPGERSYLIVGEQGMQQSNDELPISDELQTTRIDWLHGLTASVFAAGLTDLPPGQLTDGGMLDSPSVAD